VVYVQELKERERRKEEADQTAERRQIFAVALFTRKFFAVV
jgi:hypothetical protein